MRCVDFVVTIVTPRNLEDSEVFDISQVLTSNQFPDAHSFSYDFFLLENLFSIKTESDLDFMIG